MKILIASHNQGKVREFKAALEPLGYQIQSLAEYPAIPEVVEDGDSFKANARKKAESIAQRLGVMTLADDSGLVVPALDGAPGIYSARYAGEPRSDQRNNQKLLAAMSDMTGSDRQAYFVSCLVVAAPGRSSLVVEGRAHGLIQDHLDGEDGFGYDPLFYVPELGRTFAQLSLDEKNQVSHRAYAIEKLLQALPAWVSE